MKLCFLAIAATFFALTSLPAFATDGAIPVVVTYTDCWNLGMQCDYTPGTNNSLSQKSCGYKAYLKLLEASKKFTRHESDRFGGKCYLNLMVSNADGGTIGKIIVAASEEGTGNTHGRIFLNTDSSSLDGIPCNDEETTSSCYHDKFHVSPSLPKPEAENSEANCKKILDQITEDHVYTLMRNYPGHKHAGAAAAEDRHTRSDSPGQNTGSQSTPANTGTGQAGNPNE